VAGFTVSLIDMVQNDTFAIQVSSTLI